MPNMTTLDEVQKRTNAVIMLAKKNDVEAAHAAEDRLYRDLLYSIAHAPVSVGKRVLMEMAEIALKTQNFEFSRHCA